ncbi:hypothetical protein RND71_030578 [Anisodus tanguticus]|uniref:Uncharacterized protein n=1 Tax=Anisodus tanguticus TaxID=243964 RepID=A0AAE1V8D1_9SOLA|nr:hypothetical protein RND71_030578 [Anisodus tanguticus]
MDVVFSAHSYTADEAAVVLLQAGAISIIKSTLQSAEDAEVGKHKSNLLRASEWKSNLDAPCKVGIGTQDAVVFPMNLDGPMTCEE